MHGLKISETNKQAVINSAIIAKAHVQRPNGRNEFIVVFQESTRHEFHWLFEVEAEDAPQNSWRHRGFFGRDAGMGDFRPYSDFHSFIEYYSTRNKATVHSVRVLDPRRLAAMLTKVQHESIHADWTPQDVTKFKTTILDKRLKNKMRGHLPRW